MQNIQEAEVTESAEEGYLYDVQIDGYTFKIKENGEIENTGIYTPPKPEETLKPNEFATETKKNNYTDGTSYATVPKGFKVSENAEEQKIEDGLVIKDESRK